MGKVKGFTGKVGAEFMNFLLEDNKSHSAYYSQVEAIMEDGTKKILCIKDDTALKGLAEGRTRTEAIEKAIVFLKRQEEKQNDLVFVINEIPDLPDHSGVK